MFVSILSARSRQPFQSQLSELSSRQRKGSKVSRTRLKLRQLYLYLVLVFTLFSNFLLVNKLHNNLKDKEQYFTEFARRLSITYFFKFPNHLLEKENNLHFFTSSVAKLTQMKRPSESTGSLTSRLIYGKSLEMFQKCCSTSALFCTFLSTTIASGVGRYQ